MHPLKKYFNEGLIQVAIFLSLAGMRVDLDPYFPQDVQVQSSGQTHSDLWNSLGRYSHPTKSTDMDASVSIPRLLSWMRSLEHLNVPAAQLDAWLVHSEFDNSRLTIPSLAAAQDGNDDMEESTSLTVRMGGGGTEESGYNTVLDESLGTVASLLRNQIDGEDIKEEQTSIWQQDLSHQQLPHEHQHRHLFNEDDEDEYMRESWQQANPFHNQMPTLEAENLQFTGLGQDTALSAEEYLQLLEVDLPLGYEQHRADPDSDRDKDDHASLLSPMLPQHEPLMELEQQWEDVLAIMGPQDLDMDDPLDRSYFIDRGTVRETATMENPSEDSIPQTTSPSASQILSQIDFNYNYSDLMDFLLSPTPNSPMYDHHTLPDSSMEDQSLLSSFHLHPEDEKAMFENDLLDIGLEEGFSQTQVSKNDEQESTDSDSGLSMDISHSPASPSGSESSCSSSSFCSSISSTESVPEVGAIGYSQIKEEPIDEGAVGGCTSNHNKMSYTDYLPLTQFHHLPWLEHIGHDHTYNQPQYANQRKTFKQHSEEPLELNFQDNLSSRDERRARALKIPFSNDRIINSPVEEFNKLLGKHHLSEAQLALIRDIRRRGKNKVAAQNCRQRKLDTVLDLERSVSDLQNQRARLLREKAEILHSVRGMKQSLNDLYQEVWSRRREMQGILCSATDFPLQQDHISKSRRKSGKKQKDKESG